MTAAATPVDPSGNDRSWVRIDCSTCGQPIEGWDRGTGSATWKLGTHNYTKHGIRGSGPAATKKGDPTSDELAGGGGTASPVRAAVASVASAAGGKKGKPSADDLGRAFGRGVGLTVMAAAVHLVENDPAIPPGPEGDAQREYLIDRLSLSDQGARDLMAPFGRIIAPTKLNDRFGRSVVDNADAVGSIAEMFNLASSWRQYLRERRDVGSMYAAAAGLDVEHQGADVYAFPEQEPPAGAGIPEYSPELTTPAPQTGHVVTAADVERMRQQP